MRMGKFTDILTQIGTLLNVQGPAHGLVSLVEACGCEHQIRLGNVVITSSYNGKSTCLMGGSSASFKRFILNATKRHIREKLVARVHKSVDGGPMGRKDMIGIRPCLDDHAISSALTKSTVRQFIDKYPWFGQGCSTITSLQKLETCEDRSKQI